MNLIITLLSFALFVLLLFVALMYRSLSAFSRFAKDTAAAISVIRLAFAQYNRRISALEGAIEDEPREERTLQ